ncbi:MAG: phytanoyl-CoA dioxygenase family protein [Candidatus Binatia bacterium]|nr:phytanoyl-CoA dioxygenase family protein [Candidatus Binatia bacterium]
MTLTEAQRTNWDEKGYFIERGWSERSVLDAMMQRIVDLARAIGSGETRDDLLVSPETLLADAPTPEGRVSKIFRVMRTEDVFYEWATEPRLLALLADLIGPDVDCFLSQFIFKHPTAIGQPWHQDNFYFRMKPRPQVGVWLACSDATPENGPLWVVPGSHLEEVHDKVVADPREGANLGYVEIQDADTSAEKQVLMSAGDLLIFDSHLRHRSTDNVSDGMRAAMVYHYANALSDGNISFNHDWVEVLRHGEPVGASNEPISIVWPDWAKHR